MKFLAMAIVMVGFAVFMGYSAEASQTFEEDVFDTSAGQVRITFIGHGTLMFSFDGKVLHVDPYSKVADYAALPKADAVLITHEHQDHLDKAALEPIVAPDTDIVLNAKSAEILGRGRVLKNGESTQVLGIRVEAVPAYNLVHKRDNGQPFHPKGEHNGYILNFGDTRIYVAGDTENTPEMKVLQNIDVAFLPMNLPFTMTPEMVADAALAFRPKVLYPYHMGQMDEERPAKLAALLKDSGIDLRIRKLGR
jgi:L-ascorbate metabolism protein UlaG (beta-lactamase superfamily)